MKRIYPEEEYDESEWIELKIVNFINNNDILSKKYNTKDKENITMKKLIKTKRFMEAIQVTIMLLLPFLMVGDWIINSGHMPLLISCLICAIIILLAQIKIMTIDAMILEIKRAAN